MRLLETSTLKFREIAGKPPTYAILSHTWQDIEVLYHEMSNVTEAVKSKAGFSKVASFCKLARSLGFDFAWMDSCSIDKRSSAELTESINSMYQWYRDAELCIIYMADVEGLEMVGSTDAQIHAIKNSRWFKRGWTLQELIASSQRRFYAADWSEILLSIDLISGITAIEAQVLQDRDLVARTCIAERMSWASRRETTKPEDAAYSLLGLFDVNMPILYGEGLRKAFRRLQEEIMKTSFDQTLFAWRGDYAESGLLARSPADFRDTPELGLWGRDMMYPFSLTNVGLFIRPCFHIGRKKTAAHQHDSHVNLPHPPDSYLQAALQCDVRTETGWKILLLHLQPVRNGECWVHGRVVQAYRRIHCNTFGAMPSKWLVGNSSRYQDVMILEDEHVLFLNASEDAHNTRHDNDDFAIKGFEILQL